MLKNWFLRNSKIAPFNSTWPLVFCYYIKTARRASTHLAWRCCQWFPGWWQLRAQSWPGWQLGSRQLRQQPRTDRRSLTADFLEKKKMGILTKILRQSALLYFWPREFLKGSQILHAGHFCKHYSGPGPSRIAKVTKNIDMFLGTGAGKKTGWILPNLLA